MALQSTLWLPRPWITLAIVINTALLALASIIAIIFKGAGLTIYYEIAGSDSQPAGLFTPNGSMSWNAYPPLAYGLSHSVISVFFLSSAIDLTLALTLSLVLWRSLRKGPLVISRRQRQLLLAILILSCLIAIASFIGTFVIYRTSTPVYIDWTDPSWSSPIFPWDLEAWNCELVQEFTKNEDLIFNELSAANRQCALGRGARWLSMVMVMLILALSCLVDQDWRWNQAVFCHKQIRRNSWDSDYL